MAKACFTPVIHPTRRQFLHTSPALALTSMPGFTSPPGLRIRIAQIGAQHGRAAGKMATLRCNMADPFGGLRRRFLIAGTEGSMEIMPLASGQITARSATPGGPYPKGLQKIYLPVPPARYNTEPTASRNDPSGKTPPVAHRP